MMLAVGGELASDFDDDFVDIWVIHDKQVQNSTEHIIGDQLGRDLYVSQMNG